MTKEETKDAKYIKVDDSAISSLQGRILKVKKFDEVSGQFTGLCHDGNKYYPHYTKCSSSNIFAFKLDKNGNNTGS